MLRLGLVILTLTSGLWGCAPPAPQPVQLGADGLPLPKVYRIRSRDVAAIEARMIDGVNALRLASDLPTVTWNAQLTAAAAAHAQDMAQQRRPWHFGSDGSSPFDRAQRAGYAGETLGETISETYETEMQTLQAWIEAPGSSAILLDARAREMGFAWFQEEDGRIWWTLLMGSGPQSSVGF